MVIKINITINGVEKELNLLNDYLFSKLFGEKGCEEETLSLINVFTGKNFTSLTFEPNEIKAKYKKGKKSITDLIVMTNEGTIVNIESQIQRQEKFHKRSHFYNTKIHSLYLQAGQDHEKFPMSIMISILNFDLHKKEDYHNTFILCNKRNKTHVMDDIIETHYLELPQFRQYVKKGNIDLNNPKDRLMLILDKKTPQKLFEKVIQMDELAEKLYKKSNHVLQDQIGYLSYIRAEQAELDQKGMLRYAKKEGKEEEKIEIAIKLKNKGIPLEIIAETTDMPYSKIKKL